MVERVDLSVLENYFKGFHDLSALTAAYIIKRNNCLVADL